VTAPRTGRRVVWAVVWLALFSALFTAGEVFGIWPRLPPGALKDLDLAIGALALAALAAALFLTRRRPPA
jgi:hypothetical protein